MFDDLKGNGLILHHWDTDGICSAALLLDYLKDKKIVNKTPEIGNYYITPKELEVFTKYDYIIIADIAFPTSDIDILSRNSKVVIFDHHLSPEIKNVFQHNPILHGEKPEKLQGIEESSMVSMVEYQDSAGLESLTRFEDKPAPSGKHKGNRNKKKHRPKSRNKHN